MKRRSFLIGMSLAAVVRPSLAADPDFNSWLAALKDEAAKRGFSQRTIAAALGSLSVNQRVIDLDRKQPEVTLTFNEYLTRVVNDARAQTGRQRIREHADLLQRVSQKYGVQPRFIVSLWAI